MCALLADVDECSTKRPCSSNSVCKNLEGSYKCECNIGYQRNATNKDICEGV